MAATVGRASAAPFRLQLSIDGEQVVDVALSRWRTGLDDLREFFVRYLAPKLYRDIEDNFDAEGGLSDSPGQWAPLSPAYAAWKAKHYPGRGILVRTGALKRSLTLTGERPGPDGIFEASRAALVFGTRIRYARHHQRPSGSRPPRRRILFFLRGASETFGRLLHAYSVDQAKAAGLRTRLAIRAASGDLPVVGGPGGGLL